MKPIRTVHPGLVALVALVALASSALVSCTGYRSTRPASDLPLPAGAVRVYAVGDIADCRVDPVEATAAGWTTRLVPEGATVLGLGDMTYQWADAATLRNCYDPTWGRHRARTLAIAGNHDYVGGSARDFRRYFGLDERSVSEEFVAYSTSLADDWLLIALDSNVAGARMQRQREWLERTLDEHRASATREAGGGPSPRCLAVMWHTPLFSSGLHRGAGDHMRPLWKLIDAYDADLLLNGHEHFYEAFDPIDGDGRKRVDDGDGVRQFTVGTGGARLYGFWRPPYASRSRVLRHGVLELTLEPGRYSWRFLDIEGRTRDAGSAACRRAP
jgi:acid phosphatase type 7